MQPAPLATWVKCYNASIRSVFISSSAKFPLLENYPAGSGTIASPALIFSKEVPTTRCRFFFQCLFQKIKVQNKFCRDKVQMVKRAKSGRRLSLVFISLGGDVKRKVVKRQDFHHGIVATTRLSSPTLQSVTTSSWTVFLKLDPNICFLRSPVPVNLGKGFVWIAEMTFISAILLP